MSDNPKPDLLDLYLVPAERLVPRDETIPNGTTYFPVQMDRPGFIVARDPAAAGTIYVYPGSAPSADRQAIAYPNGWAPLGGKGRFWVRHSGSSSQSFQVRFDGTPGDPASGSAPSTPAASPVSNRTSGFADRKTVTTPSTAVQCPAHTIPNGFALVVKARPGNTDLVGVGFSSAEADLVTGTPFELAPGESVRYYVDDSSRIWIDALVATEGVVLTAEL